MCPLCQAVPWELPAVLVLDIWRMVRRLLIFQARVWEHLEAGGMAWGPTEWPRKAAGTWQGARPPFCRFLEHAGRFLLGAFVFAACCLACSSPPLARTGSFSSFSLSLNLTSCAERSSLPTPGGCPPPPPLLFAPLALCFLLKSSRSEMGLFPCL